MFDPKSFLNAIESVGDNNYYSVDDLNPIVCGRSGIYLGCFSSSSFDLRLKYRPRISES